ncbi:MAG: hypothetical protein BGO43_12680 [Gammaproteobacteria bacterium 39-13]|nr:hypothetical protein [Gammaproteobacteria bacterium]OJV90000.1 MAG: hypothetical protein BGO43_12680 [Gammaproteobacteria bacterium 39-13]
MPKETKIKFEQGLRGAAHERGGSFIDAVQQIILPNLSTAQIKKINAQKDFPLRKLLNANNEKNNFELLKDYIGSLKQYWNSQDIAKFQSDDLAALERTLIELISDNIYLNSRKDGEIKSKHFDKIKAELDNAENHANWKARSKKETLLENNGKRTETPISKFTPELTKEWLKITDKEKPEWFKELSKWEQKYFIKRIEEWKSIALKTRTNLGDFLGPVPTTIRRYPGAPNAYVTQVELKGHEGKSEVFTKIRSGVIVPTKMKAKNKKQKEEKVNVTKQNLEQLVVVAIQEKIKELSKDPNFDSSKPIDLPILLQTLYSPPKQPDGKYNNRAVMNALELLRKDLADPQKFIEKHKIDTKGIQFGKIDLLYSNRAVNRARGITFLTNLFNKQGRESRKTVKALEKYVTQIQNGKDKSIAEAALKSYKDMPYIRNTLGGVLQTSSNAMAEKAALEQIIAGKVGIRVGSCVSGKDREEMVTEIAIAQQEFFLKHGSFPPPYNAKGENNKALREEFSEAVARQYLTGHGHELAAENSKGCDGLKNIVDVFGKDICEKVRIIGEKEYGIKPEIFDPVKGVQKVAGLNKLSNEKLNVNINSFVEKTANFFKASIAPVPPQTWKSATNPARREDKADVAPGMTNHLSLTTTPPIETTEKISRPLSNPTDSTQETRQRSNSRFNK